MGGRQDGEAEVGGDDSVGLGASWLNARKKKKKKSHCGGSRARHVACWEISGLFFNVLYMLLPRSPSPATPTGLKASSISPAGRKRALLLLSAPPGRQGPARKTWTGIPVRIL